VESTKKVVSREKLTVSVEFYLRVSADAHFAVCAVGAGRPPPLSQREKLFGLRFGGFISRQFWILHYSALFNVLRMMFIVNCYYRNSSGHCQEGDV
jgi:hypothetical protein